MVKDHFQTPSSLGSELVSAAERLESQNPKPKTQRITKPQTTNDEGLVSRGLEFLWGLGGGIWGFVMLIL
jgi:hypothetical protein